MLKPEPSLADDESVLDDVFERALARFEAGHDVDVVALLGERQDLRAEAESMLQIARDVAVNVDRAPRIVPQRLGNYELVRPLGRGGAGVVYLARQLSVGGRLVAFKVLPVLASTDARARLLGEARALGKVRHPNVVAVHDVLDVDGFVAYAMEWIEGATLSQVVDAWRNQSSDAAARASLGLNDPPQSLTSRVLIVCTIGSAIARALGAVHRMGLLHRDVKPSNILLRRDWTPILSDFGLVHDDDASMATRSGQFLGTAAYAAPEQLRGELGAIVPASDTFGLAATLYEALALEPPYPGRTILEISMRAEHGWPERLRKRAPGVPRDLEVVLEKALAPSPRDRYATADEFADELDRILHLQPILARAPTLLARAWSLARRHRVTAAAIAATVVAVAAPMAWIAWDERAFPERELIAKRDVLNAGIGLIDSRVQPTGERIAKGAPTVPGVQALPKHLRENRARAIEYLEHAIGLRASARVRQEAEAMRAVVEVATALVERRALPRPEILAQCCPATAAYSSTLAEPASTPAFVVSNLDPRTPSLDRRLLGMLACLVGDPSTAVEALEPLTARLPSDPLADLILGYVHLVRGEHARALGPLRGAAEQAPDSKLALILLASAEVGIGHLPAASRRLEEAQRLEFADPFRMFDCVRAELIAAQGDRKSAEAIYRELVLCVGSQYLLASYSRFLARWGDLEQSLEWADLRSRAAPDSIDAQRELLIAGARWWRGVAGESPVAALECLFDRGASQGSSSRELLCSLNAAAAWFDAHEPARSGHPASEEYVPAGTRELWKRAALEPEPWSRMLEWPRPARRFQCLLWTCSSAWLADVVHHSLDLAWRMGVRRLEPDRIKTSSATDLASSGRIGDWVSRWNGPENAARALGVPAGDSCRELWRTSCVGPEPLIQDGVVYYQDDPEDRTRFVGRSLASGNLVWGPIACATPTADPPSTGCIADGYLVLPMHGLHSDRVTPARIECWPLHGPSPRRRWSWNHAGMAGCTSDLQVVTLADGTTCATTRINMARFGYDNIALLLSIATDGTFVEELRPTIHDVSGVDWSTAAVVRGLGWIRQDYERAADPDKLAWSLRALDVRSLGPRVRDVGVPSRTLPEPFKPDGIQPADIERIQVDARQDRVFLVDPDRSVLSFDVLGSVLSQRSRIPAPASTVAVRFALAADVDRLYVAAAQPSTGGRSWRLQAFVASTAVPVTSDSTELVGEPHFDVVCDGGIVLVSTRSVGVFPFFPDGNSGSALSTIDGTPIRGQITAAVPDVFLVRDEDQLIVYQPTQNFVR